MGLTSVHITNAYHASSGGIRTFYSALLEGAGREGRRVRLVVPGPETRVEDMNAYARIHFVRAPLSPVFDRRYRLILPSRFLPGIAGTVVRVLEYATRENAWLAEPTAPAFAAAIRAARRGDANRIRAARDTATRFRWSAVTQRYFALYDDIHASWTRTSQPTRLPRLDAHVIRE